MGPNSGVSSCAHGNALRGASGQEGTWKQLSRQVGAAARPQSWARGWGHESRRGCHCHRCQSSSVRIMKCAGTRKRKKYTVLSWFPASQRNCWHLSRRKLKPPEAAQSERGMPDAFCSSTTVARTLLRRLSASSRCEGSHCLPGFQVTFSGLCGNPSTTWKWIMKVI